jgi:Stealth protein CR3, conserved region 3
VGAPNALELAHMCVICAKYCLALPLLRHSILTILTGERFGLRPRPYPIHAAKSSSMPLLQEAAHIWEDEFRMTAEHKFRGMRDSETGAGDAYMSFLLTHLVVERWREALLWSWVVGRIGGDDDQWGVEQQMTAWKELGGDPEDVERKVDVRLTRRKTVEEDRVTRSLEASGQTSSKKTVYSFCRSNLPCPL